MVRKIIRYVSFILATLVCTVIFCGSILAFGMFSTQPLEDEPPQVEAAP